MTYTCIIVDDEHPARVLLNQFASRVPELEVIRSFKDSEAAARFLRENNVDILFSDILMPAMSGIELIRSLDVPPRVILTTAYSEYAVEGYTLSVTDYLVKPFRFERFLDAVNKAIHSIRLERRGTSGQPLKIRADQKIHLVDPDDIQYIEGMKEYVRIHVKDRNLITLESLKHLEDVLPDIFLRIHKSFIVNTRAIQSVTSHLVQIGDKVLPVGRTYRDRVIHKLLR